MIDAIRSIWVLYRMSLAVDAKSTIWWTFLAAVQPLGIFVFALGLRELADGVVAHDSTATTVGTIALTALTAGMVYHMVHFQADGVVLSDKHSMMIDRRIIELRTSIKDLQVHEAPQFAADLATLQAAQFWMVWETEATVGVAMGLLQLVGIGLVMWSVQPLILLLPAFVLPSILFAWRSTVAEERARQRSSDDVRLARTFVKLTTTPAAGKEIRLFDMSADLLRRHGEAWERVDRIQGPVERRDATFAALGWAIFALAYAIAIVLVVKSAASGATKPGDVLMIVVLGTQASAIAARGVFMGRTLARVISGGGRFRALERQAEQSTSAARSRVPPPAEIKDGITLDHLSFRYPGSDQMAIDGINLKLARGSVVALIGENGAGKTTLVKLLSGLYRPTSGSIKADELDLSRIDPAGWRSVIGAGFQDFCKFEFLVRESVGVGHLPLIDDISAVLAGLERSGGSALATKLPNGLETQLGSTWPEGTDISGGQWQALALARASMRPQPLLLIFDEPTAALDPHSENDLFERISATSRANNANGHITVLVSHRFSTARMADVIVVLDKGRVVESGSHTDLLKAAGLYAQLYEIQAAAYR